ncbi:MAG: sugar phosphate isomerase/epimerase [Oscillospiraceae bacterium]|nr:sugar phosphate isomerase/epimerase [Oscillospiraceae bacterium]
MTKNYSYKTGISSWAFTWNIGVAGYESPEKPMKLINLVESAAKLGAEVLQIADNIAYERSELKEAVAFAHSCGIEIELGTAGTELNRLEKHIRTASEEGIKLLRTLPHSGDDIPTSSVLAERLVKAGEICEIYGVTLAVENHDHYRAQSILDAVERVNSPFVGICYDPANNYGQGESYLECARLFAGRVLNVHYKDFAVRRMDHKMGFLIEGRPAGDGLIEPGKLAELFHPGLSWIIELWTPWQGNIEKTVLLEKEWAEKSIKYMKDLKNMRGVFKNGNK